MSKEKKNSKKRAHPLPWVAGIMLLLAATVFAGLYWNRTSNIEAVEFRGYKYISIKQLQNQVDIPIGINPDSLNYSAIIHQIKKIPYVEKVQLQVEPGGTLVVQLSERTPLAMLINDSAISLVDSNGVKLKLKEDIPDVPILYGFSVQPMADTLHSTAFKKVSHFLQSLLNNPASNATVSAVTWSDENGVVALTNNGGVKLIFGRNHFAKRLRNWDAFYANVVRYKGIEHFKNVNMSFEKQIITDEK